MAYAGKGQWLVEWIDVSEAIRGIVEMMEGAIPQTVQLRVDLARELPRIKADPSQIQQLILILLTNSIEAIGKGNRGTILINTALQEIDGANRDVGLTEELAPGTYISIAVHDSGCGMDQATLSRVSTRSLRQSSWVAGWAWPQLKGLSAVTAGFLQLTASLARVALSKYSFRHSKRFHRLITLVPNRQAPNM